MSSTVAHRDARPRPLLTRRRSRLAKTLMIRSLAESMSLSFQSHSVHTRPSCLLTSQAPTLFKSRRRLVTTLVFERGPIFAQLVLADELNRTPPKTQAALLEAMQEHEVTVGRQTYRLAETILCSSNQNPIEQEGTYPLPEAQRDRLLVPVSSTIHHAIKRRISSTARPAVINQKIRP